MTDQLLQCRFCSDRGGQRAAQELLACWSGDYDCLVQQAKQLIEATGQTVRVFDHQTGIPVLIIEILPTMPAYYHVMDWDHESWIHRFEARGAVA